ncbi:MAG: tRNA lysidine(34) synthetase TilS [Acidobacteria bacterium]|nr:MAG: tRNA lysidine(34) synthetase TilS [Acidobacteriota bacterium]
MSLETIFQHTVEQHRMFRAGQRVLVAVSGGPDSTALLHLLVSLARSMSLELHVAHLDHSLRGPDSRQDRRFVESMARDLGLPCTVHVRDVPQGSRTGLSEGRARELRYRFLGQLAQQLGAQRIATGHTRDDQAETVLLHLVRGAGTRGLAGIPPVRDPYVRPLLQAPRAEVEAWLRGQGVPWREDASNHDRRFLRNRVRHELLPLLERDYRSGVRSRLASTAELLREDQELLEQLAAGHYRRLAEPCPGGVALDADGVSGLPAALAGRVLRRAYREARPSEYAPGCRTVAGLRVMAAEISSGARDLPGGLEALREGSRLILRHRPPRQPAKPFRATAVVPGRLAWPEAGISLKMQEVDRGGLCSDIRQESREIAHLDLGRTGRHLELRSRRPGDAFYPLGLGGRKKLQDFLVDAGIPRRDRDFVGLLTAGDEVVWLVGHRLDDRFKVTDATTRVLVVRQERE